MALKRQQASEDTIALSLARISTGEQLETLPPGPIYGMSESYPVITMPSNNRRKRNAPSSTVNSRGPTSTVTNNTAYVDSNCNFNRSLGSPKSEDMERNSLNNNPSTSAQSMSTTLSDNANNNFEDSMDVDPSSTNISPTLASFPTRSYYQSPIFAPTSSDTQIYYPSPSYINHFPAYNQTYADASNYVSTMASNYQSTERNVATSTYVNVAPVAGTSQSMFSVASLLQNTEQVKSN